MTCFCNCNDFSSGFFIVMISKNVFVIVMIFLQMFCAYYWRCQSPPIRWLATLSSSMSWIEPNHLFALRLGLRALLLGYFGFHEWQTKPTGTAPRKSDSALMYTPTVLALFPPPPKFTVNKQRTDRILGDKMIN